jgi:hypothetical protein
MNRRQIYTTDVSFISLTLMSEQRPSGEQAKLATAALVPVPVMFLKNTSWIKVLDGNAVQLAALVI